MLKIIFITATLCIASLGRGAGAEDPKEGPPSKKATFKAPKEWEALGPDKTGIVTARFQTGEGASAVTATLVELAGEGGGLGANVNRWRTQVGLESLAEKEVLKALDPIKVDGAAAHRLDVTGPAVGDKPAQRIIAVVVKSGDATWFIKMNGSAGAVDKQKAPFDEFVKSIRFEK